MAHPEQRLFVENVKHLHPEYFTSKRVLGVGDLWINGGVRDLFENCDYVGLDAVQGVGVDVVSLIHEYEPDQPYDVVVSCEVWEHCQYLTESLDHIFDRLLIRSGGLYVSTHAGTGRAEHGTRKTGDVYCPTNPDFYNPHLSAGVYEYLIGGRLDPIRIIETPDLSDVYCYGFTCGK